MRDRCVNRENTKCVQLDKIKIKIERKRKDKRKRDREREMFRTGQLVLSKIVLRDH